MADAGQRRVVENIINQLAPEACVPVRLGDDHIEDQCLEDTVGQDPGEADQLSARIGADADHQVGVLQHACDVLVAPLIRPPLVAI